MPEMTIPVTMHLSVRAYRAIEPQATSRAITAGAFCAEHFDRMVAAATAQTAGAVTEVTDLPRPQLLALRKMVAAGEDESAVAAHFGISHPVAVRWLAIIGAEVRRAGAALERAEARRREAAQRANAGAKRSWKRLSDAEQADLMRLLSAGVRKPIIAERLGISVSSVSNWEKRLADIPTHAPAADRCHWECGALARGIAYMTDERTYPAPSCGDHGYDFSAFTVDAERLLPAAPARVSV